jgi:hypothetical protein
MDMNYNKLIEDLQKPENWYISGNKFENVNAYGDIIYYYVIDSIDGLFGFHKLELIKESNTIDLTFFQKYKLTKLIKEIKNIVVSNQQRYEDTITVGKMFETTQPRVSFRYPTDIEFRKPSQVESNNYMMGVDVATDNDVTITQIIKNNQTEDFQHKINAEKERIRKILGKDKINEHNNGSK